MPEISYPFDPTGIAESNLIPGEQHAVTEANYRDYYFIVPDFAPFFSDNLALTFTVQGETRPLAEGVDYQLAMPYLGASRSIGKNVYGGITLNSHIRSGIVAVTYQTLGDKWVADIGYVMQVLAEKIYNPRVTVWENVTNVQETFPPVNHNIDDQYVYGQQELIEAILQVAAEIATPRDPSISTKVVLDLASAISEIAFLKEQLRLLTLRVDSLTPP